MKAQFIDCMYLPALSPLLPTPDEEKGWTFAITAKAGSEREIRGNWFQMKPREISDFFSLRKFSYI
jgi:hypothetical protein